MKRILAIKPKAKIIIASGFTDEVSLKDLHSQGVCAFLQKPYTISPLAQTLRKVLDGQ